MVRDEIYQKDKLYVLSWFQQYANGQARSRTKNEILPHLQLNHVLANAETKERYFRRIASELNKEGHIGSTNAKGYWFIPLHTTDREELSAALASLEERRSRAMSLLSGLQQQIDRVMAQIESATQGQKDFLAEPVRG